MAVYVDNMMAPFRGMKMCHLVADTERELHEMADKIGMKRAWFQNKNTSSLPHYDVGLGKRAEAVALGAIEIQLRDIGWMNINWNKERLAGVTHGPLNPNKTSVRDK